MFAQHDHSSTHLLYAGRTESGDWVLDKYEGYDPSSLSRTELVNTATTTMRPICPVGATDALAVVYQSGTHTDFNDYAYSSYPLAAS